MCLSRKNGILPHINYTIIAVFTPRRKYFPQNSITDAGAKVKRIIFMDWMKNRNGGVGDYGLPRARRALAMTGLCKRCSTSPGGRTEASTPTEVFKGCVGEGLCPSRRAGKSAKRRQWRMKRAGFEEVPRLAAATVAGNRLARRWAREPRPYGYIGSLYGGPMWASAPTEGYKKCGGAGRLGGRPLRTVYR